MWNIYQSAKHSIPEDLAFLTKQLLQIYSNYNYILSNNKSHIVTEGYVKIGGIIW